jgi:hypothetical protein
MKRMLLLALAACDSGSSMQMMGAAVPDPGSGNGVDNNFGEVEPNDTPGTATPLGTAANGSVYVWVTQNSGGGTDMADYFVFKTANNPGTFTLSSLGICWDGGITGIDASLWKVQNGQQVMPAIQTWMSTTSCTPPGNSPALEGNSEYLLGLFFHGGTGNYYA